MKVLEEGGITDMIYFDNAATTWPKPEAVYKAVDYFMREQGANSDRTGHRMALAAGQIIAETRSLVAKLFNVIEPSQVIFTLNTTEALNLGIKGLLKPGDHVISSSLEHNSVVRPLETLRKLGIEVTKLPTSASSGVLPIQVEEAIKGNTKLIHPSEQTLRARR